MKTRKHKWWVNTGMYHKQIPVLTHDMEMARVKAYEKLIKMNYQEFCEYVSFDVSGMKDK